ncbi:hypothetical protein M569_11174, partial [Genlisea aurea]
MELARYADIPQNQVSLVINCCLGSKGTNILVGVFLVLEEVFLVTEGYQLFHEIMKVSYGVPFKSQVVLTFLASSAGLPISQIAGMTFTVGTVSVLPFYTSMIVAPRSEFTKKLMASSIPYIALGALYAYLLLLSWTPETLRLMFANQYWLPE